MDRPFQAPPRGRRPAINVTPLIDVMFLLLIFFMVTSSFRSQPGMSVDLPRAATTEAQETGQVEVAVQRDGAHFVDGAVVSEGELAATLRARLEENPELTIVLRGDARAPYQAVVHALDIARQVGGSRFVLPMTPMGLDETAPAP
jgi:biopolymer transport protein ExbD